MQTIMLPQPTWMRLGFASPPDEHTSGRDIGIVVLDTLRPHATLHHLGQRLKYVTVHDDLTVACRNVAFETPDDPDDDFCMHGLMSVLLLAHAPFELGGWQYVGLAPAANLIVLNHDAFREGEGERLKRGLAWILDRREEWNIKLLLTTGWNGLHEGGWLENTWHKPTVQGLAAALEAGLLVVAANGNTRLENELPPIAYFAVGGVDDHPLSLVNGSSPYPDEPWGRNGDGHLRPDILAPRLYLPVPYCERGTPPAPLSYFGQSSGAATLVTGICAHILSRYPHLDAETLRQVLVEFGDRIEGYANPAPRVNTAKALQALADGYTLATPPPYPPPIWVTDPEVSLHAADPIERGLALTMLAKHGQCSRARLWRYVHDESPSVRKVAVWALHKPINVEERKLYWAHLQREAEGGVRGFWAYGLLHDAPPDELALWLPWMEDDNWAVRWCVSEFLHKYPDFPELEKTHDPDLIHEQAVPVLAWYKQCQATSTT